MGGLKQLKNDAGWSLIRLLLALIRRLSLVAVIQFGRCLGWIASHLLSFRKSVAFLNLDVAFGYSISTRRKRQILRRAAGHVATMGLETIRYCYAPPETFVRNVRISGLEHLARAKAAGRGVVLAGGHVGTFTFLATRLSRAGYPSWVILRFAHDPRVAQLYLDMMARLGVNWIADRPRSRCIRECFARLRSNDILHVLIDQKPSRGKGCVVPFFGIPTEMFPGAISMALRNGAAVLPVTIHRIGLIKHAIEIGAPVEIVLTGDRQKDVEVNLARVVKTLEGAIRNYPDEWWVISRRWAPRQVAELRTKRPV
jgi:lauroyl/myristoyl acyltransferase